MIFCTSLFLTATSFGAVEWRGPSAPKAVVAVQDRVAPADEMRVEYFRPKGVSAFNLENAIGNLLQRSELMGAFIPDAVVSGFVPTIQAIGPASLVVAGRPAAIKQVFALLERLETELSLADNQPDEVALVTTQYQLRFVGRVPIERALQGFRIRMPQVTQTFNSDMSSLTIVDETATVIVHDTPARTAEIMAIVTGLDRPAPQVRLTYLLLRGHDERTLAQAGLTQGDLDHNLPAGLVKDLGSLVPVLGFERVSFGVLQGDALSRKTFADESFTLELNPANFDATSGRLSLEHVEFQLQGQRFATGASLAPDQYTVLGGVGDVPVFLVLQMTRL